MVSAFSAERSVFSKICFLDALAIASIEPMACSSWKTKKMDEVNSQGDRIHRKSGLHE